MHRFTFLAVSGAVLALAVTGCSSGSDADKTGATKAATTSAASPSASVAPFAGDSARTILAKANDAVDGATSVHVKGESDDGTDRLKLNLKIKLGTGGGGYGAIAINGQGFALRRVGSTAYMKAGAAFWKQSAPGSEKLFAGQWLKGSVKGTVFKEFSSFTSRKLLNEFLKPTGKLTRVAGKTIDGVPTVGLKDNDPEQPGILYITATGKPYPLEIVPTGKKATGSITFTEWDQPVTLTAPAGALDLDKMAGAAA